MNGTTRMLGLFAAGVVVGVIGTKWLSDDPGLVTVPAVVTEIGAVASREGVEIPEGVATPAPAVSAPAILPAAEAAAFSPVTLPASAPATAPLAAKASPFAAPIDSGSVQPIDVGERLRKHIDRPSQPGHENEIGDAHRALEREPRDDGWAYTMEAELQNSMINEVSTGGFTVEGVDCRSTLCEVRLSGTAAQSAAVKRWNDALMGQPFGQRLFMNYGSTFSDNERVDAIFIFRKPKKP